MALWSSAAAHGDSLPHDFLAFTTTSTNQPVAPVAGTAGFAGVTVTLDSTHTEPNPDNPHYFRNDLTGRDARVTLTFDRVIVAFDLEIASVRSDETVRDFTFGSSTPAPATVSGNLEHRGQGVYSTPLTDDSGRGVLRFTGFATQTVSWTIAGPEQSAIDVLAFDFAVPEPAAGACLLAVLLAPVRRRRHR